MLQKHQDFAAANPFPQGALHCLHGKQNEPVRVKDAQRPKQVEQSVTFASLPHSFI
jgi:hypothetical protein